MHWPCAVLIAEFRFRAMAFVVAAGASRSTSDHRHSKLNLTLPRRGRQTSDHGRRFFPRLLDPQGDSTCVQSSSRPSWLWGSPLPVPPRPSLRPPTASRSPMPPGSIRGSNPCTGATTITATIGAGTAIVAGGDDCRRRAGRRGAPGLAASSHGDRVAAAALKCGNEIRARIGEAEAARLERVTQQKESGQRETVGDVLRRRIARLAEKGRQRQQLVLPRLAL